MKDRSEYYHEYYLKNKERKRKNTYAWLDRQKKKLGVKGFREWKKNENAKYQAKKSTATPS